MLTKSHFAEENLLKQHAYRKFQHTLKPLQHSLNDRGEVPTYVCINQKRINMISTDLVFDTIEGFEKLNQFVSENWKREYGLQVAFELGNLSNYDFELTGDVLLVPQTYITTEVPMLPNLEKERGSVGSYGILKGTGYALRAVAAFKAKDQDISFLIGCFLNQSDLSQRWASAYHQDGVDVSNLHPMDLGMFIGTAPGNDEWPKFVEVIPGWQPNMGGQKTATNANWKVIKGKRVSIHWGMSSNLKDDGSWEFSIKAFVCDPDFDKNIPGEL